jgi:hypothetical protein
MATFSLEVVAPCLVWMMKHPLQVIHLSEPVLCTLKTANLHVSVVLLIFQDCQNSTTARSALMRTSIDTSEDSLWLSVYSTGGF